MTWQAIISGNIPGSVEAQREAEQTVIANLKALVDQLEHAGVVTSATATMHHSGFVDLLGSRNPDEIFPAR